MKDQAPQPHIRRPKSNMAGVYVRLIDRPSKQTAAFTVENITLEGLQRAIEIGLEAMAADQKSAASDAA